VATRKRRQYSNRRVSRHASQFGLAVMGVYAPQAAAIVTACNAGRKLLKDIM
jgi:hypothetical protein